MRITKKHLKKIIKEELLKEANFDTETGVPITDKGLEMFLQDPGARRWVLKLLRGAGDAPERASIADPADSTPAPGAPTPTTTGKRKEQLINKRIQDIEGMLLMPHIKNNPSAVQKIQDKIAKLRGKL